MDRASKNLYARLFASLALATFFMHVGQHLVVAYEGRVPGLAWVVVVLFLLLAVAGSWGQARLNAKRPALWATLVVSGVLPIGAFLFHARELSGPGGYGVVLVLALAFGLGTVAFTGWRLVEKN